MNIDKAKKPLKLDKKTQKMLSFDNIARRLLGTDEQLECYKTVSRHVDGSTNSRNRGERIDWLRTSSNETKEIRVLSNARCLQEGVDVPALDAVAFMEPRNSPIDIIQSIGRVMRKSDDKKVGYVIVPIPILKGDDPNYVLKKNKRYEQVNKILRAILAHDDQLQRMLNEHVLRQSSKSGGHAPLDPQKISPALEEWLTKTIGEGTSDELLEEIKNVILRLGDKSYHVNMGERLGEQAVEIETKLLQKRKKEPETKSILESLHENLKHVVGSTLTEKQTVKALAQHTVMYRVLEAMFPDNHNPVAGAFDRVLDRLELKGQLRDFEAFYRGIQADIEYFKEPDAKQDFIRSLYDSFFRGADKKASTKHGIVHTPVEVVNFILDSVQHILKKEFGKSMNDPKVKVLDPFTGTGIFISQILERNMISRAHMDAKYKDDVHASEIMLPAFYVAMSNIETSYQKAGTGTGGYVPFDGIAYMDTFDQHPSYRLDPRFRGEQMRLGDPDLKEAKNRTKRQGMDSIDVIIGNPPYSAGQKSANEANPNDDHPVLEKRIKETYTRKARAVGFKGAILNPNNSYLKAIRWASDRIENSGVIGFITPSSWITGNAEVGVRACLEEEFTDMYILNLRGNAKLLGEGWRREGGKIFGGGSREPTAIIILVKNPTGGGGRCTIHYYDIGDYLTREQKLDILRKFGNVSNVSWKIIEPDRYNDWLNQRGHMVDEWKRLTPIGSKDGKRGKTDSVLFRKYSNGLSTHRDVWVYNTSAKRLAKYTKKTINYCNTQDPDNFQIDAKQVHWSKELSRDMKKHGLPLRFNKKHIRTALYRPFFKQLVYLDVLVSTPSMIPTFYPSSDAVNPAIMIPDKIKDEFSVMITNTTPDRHIHEASQAFPLKVVKTKENNSSDERSTQLNSTQLNSTQLNLAIVVSDKIKGEFSVFITDITPDREVVHHGQVFPMKVVEK